MLGAIIAKLCGVAFCIWHIAQTKGKYFKWKPVLCAAALFVLQAWVLYYVFGELRPAQYWRFNFAVFNDSIAFPVMAAHQPSRGDPETVRILILPFQVAFVLVFNFPSFYFFLILFSKNGKIISRFSVLYAVWLVLIWGGGHIEDHDRSTARMRSFLARRYKLDYRRAIEVKIRIRELDNAVREFRRDTGNFPSQNQGLEVLVVNDGIGNWKGPYVQAVPSDPWEHPYIYRIPGEHGEFDILSDNVWGEIGNWNLDREIEMLEW